MTVTIQPGTDIAAAIAANPNETNFVLAAGTHRGMYFEPRGGINIRGNGTARLNGSVIVTGWTQHATNVWTVNSPIPGSQVVKKPSVGGFNTVTSTYPRAADAVDLFVDGVRLNHVTSIAAATNANTWYFDYAANKLYVGVNPSGKVLELSTENYAMRIYSGGNIIEGVIFERYASPLQDGAVEVRASGVQLIGCEFLQNAGAGLKVFADNTLIQQCRINYNGQLGISGRGRSIRMQQCEARGNNEKRTDEDFEGGASKFSRCHSLELVENKAWENYGKGLWLDIDNGYESGNIIRNNVILDNLGEGIHVELSFNTTVFNNWLSGNGKAENTRMYESQIFIANSSGVDVYDNIVVIPADTYNGIGLHQKSRGQSITYPTVEWLCRDVHIYNNRIVFEHSNFTQMFCGMFADYRTDLINPQNIQWTGNDYYFPVSRPDWFNWRINSTSYKWSGWQAAGYDAQGTVTIGGDLSFAEEPAWQIGTVTPVTGDFDTYVQKLLTWPSLLLLYDTQDQSDPGRDRSANNHDAQLFNATDQIWLDQWAGADAFIPGALAAQCAGNHAFKVPTAAQNSFNRNEFTLIAAFSNDNTDYWNQTATDNLIYIGGSSTAGFFLFYARRASGQLQIQLKISDLGSQNAYIYPSPATWPPNAGGNIILVARHSRSANQVKYDLWDGTAWINITTRTSPANGSGTTISGNRFTFGGYDLGSAGDDKYLILAAVYNTYLADSYLDDLIDFPSAAPARRRMRYPRIPVIA